MSNKVGKGQFQLTKKNVSTKTPPVFVFSQDGQLRTALHWAAAAGAIEAKGVLLNHFDLPGNTLEWWRILKPEVSWSSFLLFFIFPQKFWSRWSCCFQVMDLLLDARAWPSAVDRRGQQPLHLATSSSGIQRLLRARAEVDLQDVKGEAKKVQQNGWLLLCLQNDVYPNIFPFQVQVLMFVSFWTWSYNHPPMYRKHSYMPLEG